MSNPLFNMMNPNPMNLFQGMMGGNPQEMLMNLLKNQNPQAFQQIQQMMASGQDPQQMLNEMLNKMTPEQKAQLQQMANQFGIR